MDNKEFKILNVTLTEEDLIRLGAEKKGNIEVKDTYYEPRGLEKWEKSTWRIRETRKNGERKCEINRMDHILSKDKKSKDTHEDSVTIGDNYAEVFGHLFEEQFSYEKEREVWELNRDSYKFTIFLDHPKLETIRKEGKDKINLPSEFMEELKGPILDVQYQQANLDEALKILSDLGLSEEKIDSRTMYQIFMQSLFGKYDSVKSGVNEVARRVKSMKKDGPIFIFLTGPSGSGKTYVSNKIAEAVDGKVIHMDDFYREDTNKLFEKYRTYDLPDFIDVPEISRVIEDLSKGRSTRVPVYSFKRREGYVPFKSAESGVYIVEGTFALSIDELSKYADITVSVESLMHFSALRRIMRDTEERGIPPDKNVDIVHKAREAFNHYIKPKGKKAQIRIENAYNPLNVGISDDNITFESDLSKLVNERLEYQVKFLNVDFNKIFSKLEGKIKRVYDESRRYPRQKIRQRDVYYVPRGTENYENIVRIREEEDALPKEKCLFMFRYQKKDDLGFRRVSSFQCLVRECDLVPLLEIYDQVGEITKDRTEFTYKDASLNFDRIQGYGDVLEIKCKKFSTLKELKELIGIDESQLSKKPYLELISEK